MERGIRATKRELAGLDAAAKVTNNNLLKSGLQADFNTQAIKLKQLKSKLQDFLKQTGRSGESARVQMLGVGRSASSKAVWVNKKIKSYGNLSGITTSTGIKITGSSKHLGERAVVREVSKEDIAVALTNPLKVGKIIEGLKGKSQEFIGEYARVHINPDSGNLITVWKTSDRIRKKLKGES